MCISKAGINAAVCGLSKWSRLLGVGGKLNFGMNKKMTELVLLTFELLPFHSFHMLPPSPHK